jgi:hypothetical protein
MAKRKKQKLTLDRPVTYQIKVPGKFEAGWFSNSEEANIKVEFDNEGLPHSTLTCTVDQAALQGLLRRLYSLGIPLISVKWVDVE